MILPWLTLALLTSAIAEECHQDYTLETSIWGADDFTQCTTIIGNIDLGESYYDELSLPNTVNITGTITIRDPGPDNACCHSWTEGISAPVLEHLGGLVIANTSSGSVAMPRLKTVDTLSIIIPDCSWPDLSFPELVEAGSIDISPSFNSLNLDSLETVTDGLAIDYMSGGGCADRTPRPIALPSLESAGSLTLNGVLANISLPGLTSVGSQNSSSSGSGLRLHLADAPDALNITLPKLAAVHSELHIDGKVKVLELPALLNTTAPIYVEASGSPNLRIAWPLLSASTIEFHGKIEYAWLYDIENFTSISVDSQAHFDCEQFEHNLNDTQSFNPDFNYSKGPVTCSSHPPADGKLPLKLGLGLAIPLSILAAVTIFVCVKTRREKKAAKMKRVAEQDGMDLPPTFAAVERERAGDVGPGHRPRTPPPPYAAN
ncbi:hypothetical protein BJX99DRAFT_204947 [Aspergillus californicus]